MPEKKIVKKDMIRSRKKILVKKEVQYKELLRCNRSFR